MKNNKFQKFPIEDLTWGLNLKDFETEIDNKQCLRSENWNSEWNKLVSAKWYEELYNNTTWQIQWVTKDWDNIYYVQDWNIYKNWTLLFPWNEKEITFSAIDWKPLSITIDGVSKVYKFGYHNNEEFALDDLLNALQADFTDYTITRIGSVFTISSLTENVIVSNSNLIKKIEITSWNEYSKIWITIDWTTYTSDWATYPDIDDFLDYISTQLSASYVTSSANSGVMYIWKKHSAITISFTEYDRYKYAINYADTDTASN